MGYNSRSGKTGVKGSHWEGQLMDSRGPLEDVPKAAADLVNSPYKVWYEDFDEVFADNQMELMGWTVTDLGTATSPSNVVLGANRALLINPGTKADSGTMCQFNIRGNAGALGNMHKVMPEIVDVATTFDGVEQFFQVRLGHVATTAATNDNKWMVGIFTTDASAISPTTALPTLSAGGFGFHKGETGAVTCLSTSAAITAAGTACVPAVNHYALTTDATIEWHTYAARIRVIDASAETGVADFWVDGVHRLRIADSLPHDATDTMAFTIGVLNGPATVNITDMYVDYILTGITRPGLTWPYTNGVIY